ncbi:MAG: hypothetical protein ACLPIX_07875 [Rhodomicrobium sp.]
MSETFSPNSGAPARKTRANSLTQTVAPELSGLTMPFEPQSEEADALRGAISFLFTLIAFYDELIEADGTAASDLAASGTPLH